MRMKNMRRLECHFRATKELDRHFSDWLNQFEYLDALSIAALPQAQQSPALIHVFAHAALCDGAGSLFYNHSDIVDGVAKAFDEFAEPEIAEKIRGVSRPL
jgi:hypothetical protein